MNDLSIKVKRGYMLYTFLLSFLLKSIVYLTHTDISLIADTIGDLALPTYLAGLDWSYIVSKTSYYGYGFKWAYTIFFLLTDNPFVIYVSIEFLHIILQCILAVVVYCYGVKNWQFKQDWITVVWISIVISAAYISMASEAHIYMAFLIFCLLVATLVHAETELKKRVYSIIISVWTCYMITLHERCLAVIIALGILIVLWRMYEKKWLVELKAFIPAFVFFYMFQEKLTDYVIELFWSAKSAEGTLKNTTVLSDNMLWFIDGFEEFLILMEGFFTNIYTLIISTYGLGMLIMMFTVIGVINVFIKKKNVAKEIYEENKELSIVILLSAFTVFIIIAGVAVRWGGFVAGGDGYGYKGFSYDRYYLAFAWPGALAVVLLWRNIDKYALKMSRIVTGGVLLLLTILFFGWLYPLLRNVHAQGAFNAINSMNLFEDFATAENKDNLFFLSIILMIVFVGLLLWKKRISMVIYTILVLILVFGVQTGGFNISRPTIECSYFKESYYCIKNVEDDIDLPNVLYYYGHKPWNCQFMLNRYTIDDRWAGEEVEDAIIFSRKAPEVVKEEIELLGNYYYTELGHEEYLYIKGELYYKSFSEKGYVMEKVEK